MKSLIQCYFKEWIFSENIQFDDQPDIFFYPFRFQLLNEWIVNNSLLACLFGLINYLTD